MHALTSAGRVIAGRYRLDGPLGRGAMGGRQAVQALKMAFGIV